MTNQYVLMLGDVDNIKGYVYETSKLPEIRGASEILNELYSDGIEKVFQDNQIPKKNIIYSGGGSFLAWVPVEKAKKIKKDIEKKYIEDTKVATITIVYSAPLNHKELSNVYPQEVLKDKSPLGYGKRLLDSYFGEPLQEKGGFSHAVALLLSELRQKKLQKEYLPFYPALPIMKRCEYCGKRGAIIEVVIQGEEKKICEVCKTRRERGERRIFITKFIEWLNQHGMNDKAKELKSRPIPQTIPQTLEDIGDYIAFIYADGNGIGDLLLKAETEEDYKTISQSLSKGTEDAVFQSLLSIFNGKIPERLPFEIINIGGDDVSMFISSKYAWRFVIKFLENFENNMKSRAQNIGEEEITASAGIIITKHDYPVILSEKLASALLRFAKLRGGSALCHLYLTSHLADVDAGRILKSLYIIEKRGAKYSLTMRPFSLEEAKELFDLSQRFKEVYLSTQRKAFSEVLSAGMWESINFFLYQMGRMKPDIKTKAFDLLNDTQSCFGLDKSLFLYSSNRKNIFGDNMLSTPLLDIIELIEFSEKGDDL